MKRYVVIEIDEDWGDNAVFDEVQALPCIAYFYGARAVLGEGRQEREAVTSPDAT